MLYRSLLYRSLAVGLGVPALGVAAAVALGTHAPSSPARPAAEKHAVPEAHHVVPSRADSLALAFRNLQRAFARDTAELTSEAPLSEVVRLLHARADFVEVTWGEETLLLAESRLHRLQTLLDLWGIYDDRVALRSEAGAETVRVAVSDGWPPLAPGTVVGLR